jgi:hypothetical protein
LSHATSSTSLRPHQAEIEGDRDEYSVSYIYVVKISNWSRRRCLYLQFLPHFVSFDIFEWMPLEQVDDCEQLSIFLGSEKRKVVYTGNDCLEFVSKYSMRNIAVHK